MFTLKNEILRNLEEQVQYLTDYHKVNQGLAQWGIRVVGQVETESDLPDPATYQGEYGDTYAVGTEAPYSFYIWTRSAVVDDPGYWFPFGEISIVGPQGPAGPKGDKGDTGKSSRWYTGGNKPSGSNLQIGDMYLNNLGQVFEYNGTSWLPVVNITGPQGIQGIQGIQGEQGPAGPQGPQGKTGDVGGFINIWGILENTDQLPTPASLNNLTVAYLIQHGEHSDLYIQVGQTSATATWRNVGPFNAATLVTVGGEGQNVWSADTKVDKLSPKAGIYKLYAVSPSGQTSILVAGGPNNIPQYYQPTSNLPVPVTGVLATADPVSDLHAANKRYVDSHTNPFISLPYLPNAELIEGEGAPTYGGLKGWKFENDNTIRIFGITSLDDYYILGRIVLWTDQGYFSILLQQAFSSFGVLGTTYPWVDYNGQVKGTVTISCTSHPSGPEWTDLKIKFSDPLVVPQCTQVPDELASEFSVHAMDIFRRTI